jgi:hypothetical protein
MTAFNLMPYQQALWDRLATGGFSKGEMTIISSGRRAGKSYLNSLYGNNLCKEIVMPTRPVTKSKYSFSRNWYVVDYDGIKHDGVIQWCVEQFGPHPAQHDAWSRWCQPYFNKIHFRDEKDYHWFILRWGA